MTSVDGKMMPPQRQYQTVKVHRQWQQLIEQDQPCLSDLRHPGTLSVTASALGRYALDGQDKTDTCRDRAQ